MEIPLDKPLPFCYSLFRTVLWHAGGGFCECLAARGCFPSPAIPFRFLDKPLPCPLSESAFLVCQDTSLTVT